MDTNAAFSLSLLYRNDPIYSLCASDLMTASQTVNNNFIKEQKKLVKTLKKLEHQKLVRMRQLSEEKRQFAALMRRKLSQRGSSAQSANNTSAFTTGPSVRAFSAPACHTTASCTRESSARSSAKSSASSNTSTKSTQSTYPLSPQHPLSLYEKHQDPLRSNELKMHATSTRSVCKCGQFSKLITRSESCLPLMQQRVAMGENRWEYSGTLD